MTTTQPTHTTPEVSEAMVEAYKRAFGDYFAKVTAGLVFPPTADIGRHATKYALEAALPPRDGVSGMVLDDRERMLLGWMLAAGRSPTI